MDSTVAHLTPPDWPALTMDDLESLFPAPDCPCCIEPPAKPVEPVRWSTPGVFGHVDPAPAPPPSNQIAAVIAAIAGLIGAPPSSKDELQALVDTEALMQALVDFRVNLLPYLADAHARRLHVTAGQPTLGTWRARRFPDFPAADLTLAGRLRRLPSLDAAIQRGQVGLDAGRRVAAALLALAPHLDRADGLIDGQPGDEVIAAVVNNTIELIAGGRAGIPDDDALLTELEHLTSSINAGGGTQLHRLEQAFALLAERLHADALPGALGQQRDALLPNELERRAHEQSDRRGI